MRQTFSTAIENHLLYGETKQLTGPKDKWFHLLWPIEERRAQAWAALREKLLPSFIKANPGQRPWAWWKCEAGQEPPETAQEQTEYLIQRGLLTAAEKKALGI
jgi:hypothetical protein